LIDKLLTPDDEDFPLALERMDECVAYLAANGARFRDATVYISRFSALRLRALGLVAGAVREAVEHVAVAVEKEIGAAKGVVAAAAAALAQKQQQGETAVGASAAPQSLSLPHSLSAASSALSEAQSALDTVELYQLQLRFRADLGHLRRLVGLVEARGAKRAYGEVLQDCYAAYANRRSSLVVPLLMERVSRVVKDRVKSMYNQPPPHSPPGTGTAATKSLQAGPEPSGWLGSSPTSTKGALSSSEAQPADSASTSSTLARQLHRPPHSRPGSVITAATRDTSSRASVSLWAVDTSMRESVVLDAVRSAASLVSRAVIAEHSLFHALFLAPAGVKGGVGASSSHAASGVGGLDDPFFMGGSDAMYHQDSSEWGGSHTRQQHIGTAASVVSSRRSPTVGGGPITASYVRAAADAVLGSLCEEVSNVFGDVLRPLLVGVTSLEVLFDAVHVLQDEVLGELCGWGGARGKGGAPSSRVAAGGGYSLGAAGQVHYQQQQLQYSTSSSSRSHALAPFARSCETLLADLCDRLSFRAANFIGERIDGYKPQSQTFAYPLPLLPVTTTAGSSVCLASIRSVGDSDYPSRLLAYYLRHRGTPSVLTETASAMGGSSAGSTVAGGEHPGTLLSPPSIWDSWFPLLELTLVLLSKLYRTLDRGSFEALAQDAVAACTRKLVTAGEGLRNCKTTWPGFPLDGYAVSRCTIVTPSGEPPIPGALTRDLFSGAVTLLDAAGASAVAGVGGSDASHISRCLGNTADCDGLLFTIKNLLVLREQLSPFSVSLTSTTQTLDFTSTSAALSHLLSSTLRAGPVSLLTFSSNTNPLLEFLSTGMPRVAEERVNFKAHLEDLLKKTCDSLITKFHDMLVGGVVKHLRDRLPQTLTPVATPSTDGAAGSSSIVQTIPAQQRPKYATSLSEILDATSKDMEVLLPPIRRRLGLYLGSPMTASILFSPVRDRVLQTFAALRQSVYESLVVLDGPLDTPSPSSETTPPLTDLRALLEGKISRALAVLEASDALVVDPHSAAFGHDTAVFLAKVGPAAAK